MSRFLRSVLSTVEMCDRWLLIVLIILCVTGLVMVYNAGSFHKSASDDTYYFTNQLERLFLGVAALLLMGSIDYKWFGKPFVSNLIIGIGLALIMVTVIFKGTPLVITRAGCSRWINFPPMPFQPVEIVKIGMVVFLGRYLSGGFKKFVANKTRLISVSLVVLLTIIGLLLQPNYGSAFVVGLLVIAMFYVSGMKGKIVWFLLSFLIPCAIAGYLFVPKINKRILDWYAGIFGGGSYQIKQSLIGIGAGGFNGVGVGGSHQRLAFLPEAHTDFIYSIIGEEFGFIGCLVIITLFSILTWRGFKIALSANDRFGYLVASGLTIIISIYAFINISMVIGLVPVMGLPLPFISYGGTALITNMAAIGILFSIDLHNKRFSYEKRSADWVDRKNG